MRNWANIGSDIGLVKSVVFGIRVATEIRRRDCSAVFWRVQHENARATDLW